MSIRVWLRANGYNDVADKIDQFLVEFKASGLKTRRNWWDTLAGTKAGKPVTINGIEFPILKAARQRKKWETTLEMNALCRNENEVVPGVVESNRWPKKKKRARVARVKAVGKKTIRVARAS